MPLISVIVPVYNAEKTIKRCVDSIRRQTFSDVEILLIEDGAKDASGALCDSFAGEDARIRVLHKKNAGVSAARNSGMDMAQGTYIQFTDSDDYLPEDYLERLMQTQKKYGEDAFVWNGFGVVDGTDETMTEIIRYNEAETAECSRKDLFRFSGRYLLNSPWNKLFHRDVIEKNHLRMEEGLNIAEDLQFNMQYLDACGDVPVVICNTVQYRYVRTGQESLDNCYRAGYYDIHKRILTEQYRYAEKWRVPGEDYDLFYKRYWEYMQSALANLKLAGDRLSHAEIQKEKKKILCDAFFQESLKRKKGSMGRVGYYAMRSRFVWLYDLYERRSEG